LAALVEMSMERIANIAGAAADLTKLTQEQIEKAIAKANKPPTVKQAVKAGYKLEWLMPSQVGKVCAAVAAKTIQPLPRFVKG
jgi:hypothetical protein